MNNSKKYWNSLEQLNGDTAFVEASQKEFSEQVPVDEFIGNEKTKQYCMEKYEWDNDTFESISWKTIGTVRRRLTRTKQMQTSKIMHG